MKKRLLHIILERKKYYIATFSDIKMILKHKTLIILVLLLVIVLSPFTKLLNTIVAISIFLLAYFEIRRECKNTKNSKVYLVILFLILFTVTLKTFQEWLCPVIIKTDTISEFEIEGDGKDNIKFYTTSKIEEPICLKIKDSYINLAPQVDYACHNKFVYINYKFGNNVEIDNYIRKKRGFKFVYKTRAWLWGTDYKEYEAWIKNTEALEVQNK